MITRPILFSGDMVRAILSGRKTQTRRIAKPRHDDKTPCEHWMAHATDFIRRHCNHGSEGQCCPYGQPGDRLWVRETWQPISFGWCQTKGDVVRVRFAADMAEPVMSATEDQYDATHPDRSSAWRPSIHMPRWASRITLEITGIRAERLQVISLDDAKAEGVETTDQYSELWCKINGTESWVSNPWVWVVEFKRVEGGAQ